MNLWSVSSAVLFVLVLALQKPCDAALTRIRYNETYASAKYARWYVKILFFRSILVRSKTLRGKVRN